MNYPNEMFSLKFFSQVQKITPTAREDTLQTKRTLETK